MNFDSFNMEQLQTLHISYKNLLRKQIEQLTNLPESDSRELISELLKLKISSFETAIYEIEMRINQLNSERLRFSTEYMLWNFGAFQKSVQVHFVTTSESYKAYGEYVTGVVLFDKDNLPELIERVKDEGHTDGVIKFEETVSTVMTIETKEKLRTEGFYASEIDSICFNQ